MYIYCKKIYTKNKMNRFREKPQRFVEKSKMKIAEKNLTEKISSHA